jgi:curli biogenesis system outer membrane secretion channel CsgG
MVGVRCGARATARPCAGWLISILSLSLLTACATPAPVPTAVQPPVAQVTVPTPQPLPSIKIYKRKIAIGRFTNETRYGKALLTGDQLDPLGKQTSDMLSTRLVESGRFLVFERPDLNLARNEQVLSGIKGNIVGVDTLIVGSLTEFGREIEGEAGFLSNTKRQIARAKVEARLVDVKTGRVFFSAPGTGKASVEAGTVMGFGNQAGYDSTLNDRAIGAAISDMMTALVSKLQERPWRTDLLKVEARQVFITGGERQGVRPGDRLAIMQSNGAVRSAQTGFDIDLPPTKIGELVVDSNFGDDETNEGSVCHIVSGTVPSVGRENIFVTAANP